MSILIKGMEMPKDGCHHTICIYADGTVSTGGRAYTAIPVPPHGRLIDADALIMSDNMVGKMMIFGGEYVYTKSEIDRAPTIIPAEESAKKDGEQDGPYDLLYEEGGYNGNGI